jgi:hypothetical protein
MTAAWDQTRDRVHGVFRPDRDRCLGTADIRCAGQPDPRNGPQGPGRDALADAVASAGRPDRRPGARRGMRGRADDGGACRARRRCGRRRYFAAADRRSRRRGCPRRCVRGSAFAAATCWRRSWSVRPRLAMDSLIYYETGSARCADRVGPPHRRCVFTVAPRTALLMAMWSLGKVFPRSDRSPVIPQAGAPGASRVTGRAADRVGRVSAGLLHLRMPGVRS